MSKVNPNACGINPCVFKENCQKRGDIEVVGSMPVEQGNKIIIPGDTIVQISSIDGQTVEDGVVAIAATPTTPENDKRAQRAQKEQEER